VTASSSAFVAGGVGHGLVKMVADFLHGPLERGVKQWTRHRTIRAAGGLNAEEGCRKQQ
jgi:hypothetical protein